MEDPCAKECILEANPLHADQLEILDLLESPVYALNTVLNEDREISFVSYGERVTPSAADLIDPHGFQGEIRDSHALAVEFVKPFVEVRILSVSPPQ